MYEETESEKKPYDEINDVEFHILTSKAGNQLGWLWFGVTKFEKQIPVINEMRGIRLRKEKAQKALEEQKNAAEEAQKKIERKQHDAENDNNSIYQRVFKQIEDTYKPKTDISNEKSSNISNNESDKKFLTQKLSKYNKQEQKLISRIYNIIKLVLPNDMAEMLVTKIQEELQK